MNKDILTNIKNCISKEMRNCHLNCITIVQRMCMVSHIKHKKNLNMH